jgi:hypothetical protein
MWIGLTALIFRGTRISSSMRRMAAAG